MLPGWGILTVVSEWGVVTVVSESGVMTRVSGWGFVTVVSEWGAGEDPVHLVTHLCDSTFPGLLNVFQTLHMGEGEGLLRVFVGCLEHHQH